MPEEPLSLISYATSPGAKQRYVTPVKGTWPEIVARLSKPQVVPVGQKDRTELVFSGTFSGEPNADGRLLRKGALLTRSMVTLDIDDCNLTFDDIEERVAMGADGCYLLYTTFSHRGKGSVRIFITLSREVTADEYRAFAPRVSRELGLFDYCDPCSWRPSEGMFVHATDEEGKSYRRKSAVIDGTFWPVPDVIEGVVERENGAIDEEGDEDDGIGVLMAEVKRESFSEERVDEMLEYYDPEHLHYDRWLEVGAALNWRYNGSDEGFYKWVEWSSRSSKHDTSGMSMKWKSFNPNSARATTLSTIVMRIQDLEKKDYVKNLEEDSGNGNKTDDTVAANISDKNEKNVAEGKVDSTLWERLLQSANRIENNDEYDKFLKRVRDIPNTVQVNGVHTKDLCNAVIKSPFNEDQEYGIRIIAKDIGDALKKRKAKALISLGGNGPNETEYQPPLSSPTWCRPWVFIGSTGRFYNIHTNTIYPREAFDLKYGGMPELGEPLDLTPAKAAVQVFGVPVVDAMGFNPLGPILYETEEGQPMAHTNNKDEQLVLRTSKRWLNTYQPYKLEEASDDEMKTDDAKAVIDRFLWHVKYIIGDERQEALLIDWLAHNIKTPGKKINWAIVLQGIYGTGKTYFFNLLEAMLGPYAKAVANKTLTSHFTGWATGSLVVCIDELRMAGQNRYEIVDTLKPYISNPTVAIEAKGENSIHVPNFTNYLAFTNHKDAVPVDRGERRYCILFSKVESEDQMRKELVDRLNTLGIRPSEGDKPEKVYFDMLFSDLQDFPGVLLRFFKDHQYSDHFSPRGAAPMTEAKKLMMELTKPAYQSDMEEYIDEYHCEVINENIVDLYELKERCPSIDATLNRRQQAAALTALGYTHLNGAAQHKLFGKKHVIYVKNAHEIGGPDAALCRCREFAGERDSSDMF